MSNDALLIILAPVSVLIVRHLGLQRTVTVSVMTAVVGIVLTGYASKVWHVVLSLSVLTCEYSAITEYYFQTHLV